MSPTHSLQLRILPLAVFAIVLATAVPSELRLAYPETITWWLKAPDILLNLLLYFPLGVALRSRTPATLLLIAVAMSASIESLQVFYVGRHASLTDIAMNTLGALSGFTLARVFERAKGWSFDTIGLDRRAGLGAFVLSVLLLGLTSIPGTRPDFSNWDPDYQFAIGNELTLDRPWRGTVSEIIVFDQPLDAASIREWAIRRVPLVETPVLHLELAGSADDLRGEPLLDRLQTRQLFDALVRSGAMTLLVRFRTDDLEQYGPARIVTFSKDGRNRNFTLSQDGRALNFRLRTPVSGPNGNFPDTDTPELLTEDEELVVAVSFDSRVVRVFVNGLLAARTNLAAAGHPIPDLADYGLPASASLLGLLLAMSSLTVSPFRIRWVVCALAGAFGGLLLVLVGGTQALPTFSNWVPWIGLAGGLVIPAVATRSGALKGIRDDG